MTIRFYMKSGNLITVEDVANYRVVKSGDSMEIEIGKRTAFCKQEFPILSTLDLSSIDCMTVQGDESDPADMKHIGKVGND